MARHPAIVHGATHEGKVRDHNEDSLLCLSDPDGGVLLAVCDGLGGHAAGELASQLTVAVLTQTWEALKNGRDLSSPEQAGKVLSRAIQHANKRVREELRDPDAQRSPGTTCTAVIIKDGWWALGQVGDSRAYRLRGNEVEQLSDDHTYVAEHVRAGTMRPEDAKTSPFRGHLTRSVGAEDAVKVDVANGEASAGDVFLLCTDGLHEYFNSNNDLLALVADQRGPEPAVSSLIHHALVHGGHDNVTVAVCSQGPWPRLQAPVGMSLAEQRAETVELSAAAVKSGAERQRAMTRAEFNLTAVVLAVIGIGAAMLLGAFLYSRHPAPTGTASPALPQEPSPQETQPARPSTDDDGVSADKLDGADPGAPATSTSNPGAEPAEAQALDPTALGQTAGWLKYEVSTNGKQLRLWHSPNLRLQIIPSADIDEEKPIAGEVRLKGGPWKPREIRVRLKAKSDDQDTVAPEDRTFEELPPGEYWLYVDRTPLADVVVQQPSGS
jgi:protein phosphatase